MKFKYAQWVLFLIVAIGTFWAMIGFEFNLEQRLMTLVALFSVGLFIYCFLPYIRKFYLSEVMIVVLVFGVVMTLYTHAMSIRREWTNWDCLVVAMFYVVASAAPFLTHLILENQRPYDERISTLEMNERLIQRLEAAKHADSASHRATTAKYWMIIEFICGVIALLSFLVDRTCGLGCLFPVFFVLSYQAFCYYKRVNRKALTERSPEKVLSDCPSGENDDSNKH